MSAQPDAGKLPALVSSRPFITSDVCQAAESLLSAVDRACAQDGVTRDEAESAVSLLLAALWEKSEDFTRKLPAGADVAKLTLGLKPEKRRGRPRQDGPRVVSISELQSLVYIRK